MTENLRIHFMESDSDLPGEFSPSFYPVPSSKRTITIWANEASTDVYIAKTDLSEASRIPQVPEDIRSACSNALSEHQVAFAHSPEAIIRSNEIPRIYIPNKMEHVPNFIKATLMKLDKPETALDDHGHLIFSMAFSTIALAGGKLFELVKQKVNHAYLPYKLILSQFDLVDSGPAMTSTVVNVALSSLLSIGKATNLASNAEFQKKRYDACIASAGLVLATPPPMPMHIFNALNRGWIQFIDFIKSLVEDYFIKTCDGMSLIEVALIDQAKMICQNAYMTNFNMSLAHLPDFMKAHWLCIRSVARDLRGGYKEALKFYHSVERVRRPYIRLLRIEGFEKMEYKNYPYVYYATGCLEKFEGGQGSSIQNMRMSSVGMLKESDLRTIRIAAATNRPSLSGVGAEESEMNDIRNEWLSVFRTETDGSQMPSLGEPLNTSEDSLEGFAKKFVEGSVMAEGQVVIRTPRY